MTARKPRTRQERNELTARDYFLEQAAAYFDDLKATAHNAPYGQFLNHAEQAAIEGGRELTRLALETTLQDAIDDIEKKNETRPCPKCQKKKRHQGYRRKNIETGTGKLILERLYDKCLPCDLPEHVADKQLGLEAHYTVGLRRLAVRAGASKAFEEAQDDLQEYCGLKLSHETISKLCQQEAVKMKEWQKNAPEVQEDFIESPGNVEITMDGVFVNTTEGYRETKVGIISKRELGEGVLPEQLSKRKLPRHTARVAFAAVEEKELFQERFQGWRRRLQVGAREDISTLGDGAPWIWNISSAVFGRVRECLDFYHATEHLSDTSKVLYGEGTETQKQCLEEAKGALLAGGYEQVEQCLNRWEQEVKPSETQKRESLRLLRGYLENNRERLNYAERLEEGRAIGSGQVEGACKSMIGKRLKQTGAKWLVPRLNRMTVLCSVRYSSHWKQYWKKAN